MAVHFFGVTFVTGWSKAYRSAIHSGILQTKPVKKN